MKHTIMFLAATLAFACASSPPTHATEQSTAKHVSELKATEVNPIAIQVYSLNNASDYTAPVVVIEPVAVQANFSTYSVSFATGGPNVRATLRPRPCWQSKATVCYFKFVSNKPTNNLFLHIDPGLTSKESINI